MKVKLLIIGLIVGVLIGFALTKIFISEVDKAGKPNDNVSLITANNADTTKWKWADSLDAVKAAPQNHRVIFENDKIRILDVTLQPYEYEQMHTHRLPSVMFGNGKTSQFDIIYYRYDYDSIKHKYFVKDSIKQHNRGIEASDTGKAHYMKPEGPHRIKNLSNVKIDVYRVEFKPEIKE